LGTEPPAPSPVSGPYSGENGVDVDDDVLVERVRPRLGRASSHLRAIDVLAWDGVVTLRGPILRHELKPVLRAVERVPGVRRVVSELDEHRQAGNIPALQGGSTPAEARPDVLQRNWSPSTRVVAAAARWRWWDTARRGGRCPGSSWQRRARGCWPGLPPQRGLRLADARRLAGGARRQGQVRAGGRRPDARPDPHVVQPARRMARPRRRVDVRRRSQARLDSDLVRMKTLIETGRLPHDAAQPDAGRVS
jgi:hypothetical protein